MAAIIPNGTPVWGFQLPIQSQSTRFVQPWEVDAGAGELAEVVRAADRAGAFYVGVCDHVGVPRPADQEMSATWYEPVSTLGWIAGLTTSVHLLSHVLVLPYRHPLATAKAFITLDHLSGGRAILGAGAGHLRSEFEILGVDHATRGRAVEEALGVIRAAFTEGYPVVEAGGKRYEVGMAPRPARNGGPPIWLGGSSPAAIRRAARLGDGWLPQGPPEMGMRAAVAMIHEERARLGLSDRFDLGVNTEPIHLGNSVESLPEWTLTGSPTEVAERLRRYSELGVNQLQLRFLAASVGEYCDQVERFGREVAPLLQS